MRQHNEGPSRSSACSEPDRLHGSGCEASARTGLDDYRSDPAPRRALFLSSRRRHTMWPRDWSSDVCSSDLVPAIEKAIGRYGTLVTVVMYEHEEIRRGVAKFGGAREELRRNPNSWPAIQELNRHGIFLVQFLWDHFRKENTSLFPTARKVLSADAIRKITEQISAP